MDARMIWEGAVSKEMVPNWTKEQVDALCVALDDAVSAVVDTYWGYHAEYDPVVREQLIDIVGVDNATNLIQEAENVNA